MKKAAINFILLILAIPAIAQVSDTTSTTKTKKPLRTLQGNSIYAEIGGNAMFLSVNYERVLVKDNRFYLIGRVGLGMGAYVRMSSHDFLAIPLLLNFQYQLSNVVVLEFGVGSTLSIVTSHQYFNPLITGVLGIRAQSKGGFLFKAGLTPLVNLDNTYQMWGFETFLPWAGISLGYSFGR
jgi:hypothetical protein